MKGRSANVSRQNDGYSERLMALILLTTEIASNFIAARCGGCHRMWYTSDVSDFFRRGGEGAANF